jgi:LacI family gluconate utilization system Gnt-I transcriptional repressor
MKKVAPRNPTLGDVAALAQVSTATISRFLNSPDVVAPETGKRIARAIAATGYIPNLLAGGLASRKSKMVAVLIPHLAHSIFNDMIETMAEELARGGTTVMMALTGGEEERTDAMIQAAIGRRVDAIISTAPVSEETVEMLRRFPGLFIQIWDLPERPVGLAVGFSHRAVGRDVARFLSARGYRHPLLVTTGSARAVTRCDGFVEGGTRWAGAWCSVCRCMRRRVSGMRGGCLPICAICRNSPMWCCADRIIWRRGSSSRRRRRGCACPISWP